MTASVLVLDGQWRCITLAAPATPSTRTGKCVSNPRLPQRGAAGPAGPRAGEVRDHPVVPEEGGRESTEKDAGHWPGRGWRGGQVLVVVHIGLCVGGRRGCRVRRHCHGGSRRAGSRRAGSR